MLSNALQYKRIQGLLRVLFVAIALAFFSVAYASPDNDKPTTEQPVSDPVPAAASTLAPASAEDKNGDRNDKGEDSASYGSYLSGRFAESLGDTDNGIRFLRKSLVRDPNNSETLFSLYRMLMLSGRIKEALPIAQKLDGVKSADSGNELTPGVLLLVEEAKRGDFAAAQARIPSLTHTGFGSLLVPLLDHWIKLGLHQIKEPVDGKNVLPAMRTVFPHIYLNTGFINDIAGFDDAALKQYLEAVRDTRIQPFRAVEALANYYARHTMPDKRKALIDQYVLQHGESFLADEVLLDTDTQDKKPLVKDASEGIAEAFYTMANLFHGVRSPADEIVYLRLALYLRPNFPPAQFLMASAYEMALDYRSAIEIYKEVDQESPYYARGRIRSVYDENELGNKDKAMQLLDKIVQDTPESTDALLVKGDLLRAKNKCEEAIASYDDAASRLKTLKKYHWVIFFSRATCYEHLGEWAKAEADLNKALELQPGQPDVLNYLGYSWLIMNKNPDKARKMIEDAYEARPEDAHIIDSMGYALYLTGDFNGALEYFEQAMERTPNDPTVNEHVGDTYWQMGRKNEAKFQWQRALENDPDAQATKNLKDKLKNGVPVIKMTSTTPRKVRAQLGRPVLLTPEPVKPEAKPVEVAPLEPADEDR